jgi:APA family basic amino acid/polyamine antiporter
MGEIIAWIIGWDLLLEYALGAATVAIGWSGYVVSFLKDFGISLPDIWTAAPFDFDPAGGEWQRTAALSNVPAMLVTAIASMLLVVGINESAKVNNFIVVVKVGIVMIFIFVSIWFVNTANWVTAGNPDGALIPPSLEPGQFGWSGILRGAALVFFAYIGFDAVSTAAQEASNPQRDMPIAFLGRSPSAHCYM